ncbi:MAG TPA: DUF885 family protein, partial [Thermoanaerobaculia bacterium]|nr:DUF885 family protein [Thermoanaerobaculia bacterium]
MRRFAPLALTVVAAISSAGPRAAAAAPSSHQADIVTTLHDLFDREWAWRLKQSPELATSVGVHDDDDKLSDLAPETLARQAKETEALRAELRTIDRDALPFAEQANYDIFSTQLRERVESYGFGEQYLTINADSGFYSGFPLIWQSMPFQSAKGYENYIARLRAFPRYMDQNIALMREGLKRGMTPPKVTLVGIEKSIQPLAVFDDKTSALWTPFTRMPPQ